MGVAVSRDASFSSSTGAVAMCEVIGGSFVGAAVAFVSDAIRVVAPLIAVIANSIAFPLPMC